MYAPALYPRCRISFRIRFLLCVIPTSNSATAGKYIACGILARFVHSLGMDRFAPSASRKDGREVSVRARSKTLTPAFREIAEVCLSERFTELLGSFKRPIICVHGRLAR